METKTKFFSVLFGLLLLIPCFLILTACNNPKKTTDDEDVTLKDNEITINVSNKVYDGQAIAVTATATSGVSPTIVYKLAGADDSAYTSEAPKNVGEYVVGAGVEANGEYKQAYKTQQFSITPKEVTIAWTAPANLVYDGQIKEPTVNITSGLLQGDSCDVQKVLTDGNDNVNVGTFTYTANGLTNPNYKLPANAVSGSYTITPIILENLEASFEYSGSATHEQSLASVREGLSIQITFDSANAGAEIDSYKMLMNGEETENYNINTANCVASIVQKEVTLTWTAPANLKFNNQAKVPTVAAGNLAAGEIDVNVSAELTSGNDNTSLNSTFTYTATGLTGSNALNYKLPTDVTSPSYEITIDELTLNEEVSNFRAVAGENWFAIPVGANGRYEVKSTFSDYNKHFIYSYDGTDFTEISLGKKYSAPYNYICFDGDADTTYYLMININSASTGSVIWTSHEHQYDEQNACYCGHFNGTELTVGKAQQGISASSGEVIKFRFRAEAGKSYYITQSNLGTTGYAVQFGGQGEQSFEQAFVHAFGESNKVEAPDDEWVYITYTAPAAVENASITINVVAS